MKFGQSVIFTKNAVIPWWSDRIFGDISLLAGHLFLLDLVVDDVAGG